MIVSFGNIIPALIAAGAAVATGIASLVANHKTNKTNRKIAASVNESNARINESQLKYNWDMWQSQNDYNNPVSQRKRLTDAGLNPIYYGLDGNSASSGSSFSPIPAEQSAPNVSPDFSSFEDAILKFAQIKNIEANTKKQESESGLTTEQAETARQLRTGQLVLLGQQIKLTESSTELNKSSSEEKLATVDSLRQSLEESKARIDNIRSEIDQRRFDRMIQRAYYELEQKYKQGLLSLQEKQLAVSWFNAFTDRQNASTNYFNAETARMSATNQVFQDYQMLPYKKRWMSSMSTFNSTQSRFTHDQNLRLNKAFNLDQISRAANAYQSVVDVVFSVPQHNVNLFNSVVGR